MDRFEPRAREAIRDLVARYNQCGDSGRFDELVSLFCEDATVEVLPDARYQGVGEIRQLFEGVADGTVRLLRHFVATHQIHLESPTEASGRCYFAVLTENGLDHWGTYRDQYRAVDGEWRFAARRVKVEGETPGGWAQLRRG